MVTQLKFPPVRQNYYPLGGGLDQVTPAIAINPGRVIDSQNYEPAIGGGYRRIDGYERFDGRASPTAADYWVINATITGALAVGNTVTGATSAATGVVLFITSTYLVLARVTGTFMSEVITVAAVNIGSTTSATSINGAIIPSDHADYKLLSANDWRAFILVVPGSGSIRGVWVFNDIVYAFRDNAGVTAGTMWKSSAAGWVQVTFGSEISFGVLTTSSTVTITIATPGVVSYAAHPFVNGQPVSFSTTGALPTGLTAGTVYYVKSPASDSFSLSATNGGSAITLSTDGSGIIQAIAVEVFAGQGVFTVTAGSLAIV